MRNGIAFQQKDVYIKGREKRANLNTRTAMCEYDIVAYSPALKPIERVLPLVRSWARDHEAGADRNDPSA